MQAKSYELNKWIRYLGKLLFRMNLPHNEGGMVMGIWQTYGFSSKQKFYFNFDGYLKSLMWNHILHVAYIICKIEVFGPYKSCAKINCLINLIEMF
jgi:hypothetical protein